MSRRPLLETALLAAEAAAAVHRNYWGRVRGEEVSAKGSSDFVSHVDLEAQAAALDIIRERFPSHRIMSEEEDGATGPSAFPDGSGGATAGELLWIIDPLDGTTNYLHGHPAFAASIGVVEGVHPVAGAIHAAATGERWWASEGEGAWRNGEPIRVSEVRGLQGALIGTGFPFKRLHELPGYLEEFGRVLPACSGIRRGGAAALDLCYLAQGSLDAFWEGELAPWDIAAGLILVKEAGGVATRMDEGPLDARSKGPLLAANSGELLGALRAVLRPPLPR